MKKAKTVDAYLSAAPKELRGKLKELRAAIRAAAPRALEKISYGMPAYSNEGAVAYFALAKAHIGLYVPPPVLQDHEEELKGYSTARATVRFPLDRKLPIALIRKLIKARVKLNESKGR